ncbi:uncharacterized protein LOC143524785 isoform X1 [Brachyhypopomus gauderio]|uniref:uncharacterized protein LOC143524785 isoform X1 n=1 Tax=Brachyhypopomus gauderio TaxID=698409 RepID=UPI004042D151
MDIYQNSDRRADSDSDNEYEDIYANAENVETCKIRSGKEPVQNKYVHRVNTEKVHIADPQYRETNSPGSRCSRLTAVCLGLLCVLLLTVIIVMWVKLQTRYNSLTAERDQLQTRSNSLTAERDQLQTRSNSLTAERDQLQTRHNNLTAERDQLQTRYNILTAERDQLQKERELQKKFFEMERDQLQTSNYNLTLEKDQLQTSYNKLTIERDQLQSSNYNLTLERDQLKKESGLQRKLCELDVHVKKGWTSSWVYLSDGEETWSDSRKYCQDRGADLIIINSKEKQDFVAQTLANKRAWIGLTDQQTENDWKWVDGSALTTVFWASGEPNNAGEEDCVEVSERDGKWNDLPCSFKKKCICEKRIA